MTIDDLSVASIVLDVGVKEQGIHLGVDVLNKDLEAVETFCFRRLYLLLEVGEEVFVDNPIGACKG